MTVYVWLAAVAVVGLLLMLGPWLVRELSWRRLDRHVGREGSRRRHPAGRLRL